MNKLADQKLALAKAISERESTLARKEAELAALKEDLRSLEASEPAVEHAKELDGTP
jgi:kinetochore protein Spc24